ncbi:MAG TPA: hypothetical protein VGS02_18915 [Acidobacteriaceae bacterium]|nr:hypothetical protein [Acidobacteriaceae bacterium]
MSKDPDRFFFVLLAPLMAVSLPSVAFCALGLLMWGHRLFADPQLVLHVPAENLWDHCFLLEANLIHWISRWNAAATLAATGLFVFTLLRPRWRYWAGLALIPYGVLLCADFTMRWRYSMLP